MTDIGAPARSSSVAVSPGSSFVEWGAVWAGAALAAALSFVFLTFGTAIGLSATSPWPNSGLSAKVIASLAVFWAVAQQIGSMMIGGYVAGRMRSRWQEAGDEAEFRDGLHGGLVWAVGALISAFLIFATAGAIAKTGADVAKGAASAASRTGDPLDMMLDTMLRPQTVAQAPTPPAATTTTPSTTTPAPAGAGRARAANPLADDNRAEMNRIVANAVTTGGLSSYNRSYLAQLVAQRTGLSQQEAEKRVDDAVNSAREAADKARRAAVLTGFVTAAGLILSLGAGWWAAMRGGHHRDNSIPARFVFEQRRRPAGT